MAVDDAKCEDCHSNLTLHGNNRHDATGYCGTCHMADETDEEERIAVGGAPPNVCIHMKYMVHNIHMGAESYVPCAVYGHNGSFNPFGDVHYPGDLARCDACHADVDRGGRNPEPETYWLPLPDGVLDTVAPSDYWSPLQPAAESCMSCHDYPSDASHIDLNTGDFGESCNTCHADGKTYSAEAVHALSYSFRSAGAPFFRLAT
jgi:OmcA/MtrC family decaheme c-type cytochrome